MAWGAARRAWHAGKGLSPLMLSAAVLACSCSEDGTSKSRRYIELSSALSQAPPPVLGAFRTDPKSGAMVAPWGAHEATLSIVPELQRQTLASLERGRPRRGATVLLEAKTGRVLALAGYSSTQGHDEGIALQAFAPAASIFKIPAVSALLRAGLSPDEEVCFSGGKRRLAPRHLDDEVASRCAPMGDIIPLSLNAALARLVDKRLPLGSLREEAQRFGFDRPVPFVRPVETSLASIPADRFERAKAGAGFGDVHLSALHGAIIASIPANRGQLVWPRLVDATSGGEPVPTATTETVMSETQARELARQMKRTVLEGTGRKAFSQRPSSLAQVSVAGKTGSLTIHETAADYSWFVGYAPVDKPEVVVATVIENEVALWYVRGPEVARDALAAYFQLRRHAAVAQRSVLDSTQLQ
ncbi:MAG: penicillin-binding transpeptidase domain-containing protein [Myxococcota bacterium]